MGITIAIGAIISIDDTKTPTSIPTSTPMHIYRSRPIGVMIIMARITFTITSAIMDTINIEPMLHPCQSVAADISSRLHAADAPSLRSSNRDY